MKLIIITLILSTLLFGCLASNGRHTPDWQLDANDDYCNKNYDGYTINVEKCRSDVESFLDYRLNHKCSSPTGCYIDGWRPPNGEMQLCIQNKPGYC